MAGPDLPSFHGIIGRSAPMQTLVTSAQPLNDPSDQFLPGPRLALYQNRDIGRRNESASTISGTLSPRG